MPVRITRGTIHIHEHPMFSGGGTQPKPPKAPVKKPGKKPKK